MSIFTNPKGGDFSVASVVSGEVANVGADTSIMAKHQIVLDRHAVKIEPTNYKVDYLRMIKKLLINRPKNSLIDKSHYTNSSDTYLIINKIPENSAYYKATKRTSFKLKLEYYEDLFPLQ